MLMKRLSPRKNSIHEVITSENTAEGFQLWPKYILYIQRTWLTVYKPIYNRPAMFSVSYACVWTGQTGATLAF